MWGFPITASRTRYLGAVAIGVLGKVWSVRSMKRVEYDFLNFAAGQWRNAFFSVRSIQGSKRRRLR